MANNVVIAPKQKKKRLAWYDDGEVAILDQWEERVEELRGVRKNGHIYAEMSVELSKLGHPYSARDIQVKLQNFTQRYRKEKVKVGASGGSPSLWPHYERVHKIIGGFKANAYKELSKESIDESSIASSSSTSKASPRAPLPSPSSPLAPSSPPPVRSSPPPARSSLPPVRSSPSPSPRPSTSAAALEAKRKRKSNFQEQLLQKFDNLSSDISEHLAKSDENEKELIAIEKKKAESLEKLLLLLNKD